MFRFVARFARVRIEDSSFNRFTLNGIQRDFLGGIFSGGIFVGGILSGYPPPMHVSLHPMHVYEDTVMRYTLQRTGGTFMPRSTLDKREIILL